MRLLLLFLVSLVFSLSVRAQERVRNVRIQVVDASKIQIWYDLIEARPGDSVYVEVESKLRGPLSILPEYIRGDIGRNVVAGNNLRIVWDAVANGYPLNEDIRASVLVKAGRPIRADQNVSSTPGTEAVATTPSKSKDPETTAVTEPKAPDPKSQSVEPAPPGVSSERKRYAGPAWALLSAVAPGVGNIFVQTPKPKVGLRPLLTVGCYGLAAWGLWERQKSQDDYAIYEQQKNAAAGDPYYATANSHHHNYFIATRGAVVIAAADVILTFIRGLRNTRLQRATGQMQSVTLWPGVQAGQPTAVVRVTF